MSASRRIRSRSRRCRCPKRTSIPSSRVILGTIFATRQNADVCAYDIRNPFAPKELAYFVPPFPATIVDPRPRPIGVNSTDVYDDPNGLMCVTDDNAGLYILEYWGD